MKYEWYEIPINVWRNGVELTVPANEVEDGDYVNFMGMKRKCNGVIPDDDEEIMYIRFGIDDWPVEMCA